MLAVVATDVGGRATLVDLADISSMQNTGEYLAQQVSKSLENFGIKQNSVNAFVTDEAANYKKAREILVMKSKKSFFHYRCMAHTFNLMIGSFARSALFHSSRVLPEFISLVTRNKQLCAQLRANGLHQLVGSSPTRWYSTGESIRSTLEVLPFMRTHLDRLPEKIREIIEDTDFWRGLQDSIFYFDQFANLVGVAEAADSRLSVSFRAMLEFARDLESKQPDKNEVARYAYQALLNYFEKLDLDMLLTAYALDPNHKMAWLSQESMRRIRIFIVTYLLDKGFTEDRAASIQQDFVAYRHEAANEINFIEDVYGWWCQKSCYLSQIGRRLSSCTAGSANTERIFSALKNILTPRRNRLGMETLYNLMVIKTWSKSQSKYKRRGRVTASLDEEHEVERCAFDGDFLDLSEDSGVPCSNFFETELYMRFHRLIDFTVEDNCAVGGSQDVRSNSDNRARAAELVDRLSL